MQSGIKHNNKLLVLLSESSSKDEYEVFFLSCLDPALEPIIEHDIWGYTGLVQAVGNVLDSCDPHLHGLAFALGHRKEATAYGQSRSKSMGGVNFS